MRSKSWCLVLSPLCFLLVVAAKSAASEEKVLYDFEDEASVKAWANVDVYALREAEAMACSTNAGKVDDCEACMRGRPSYHRVDLSSIPKGSRVLAARLMMVHPWYWRARRGTIGKPNPR